MCFICFRKVKYLFLYFNYTSIMFIWLYKSNYGSFIVHKCNKVSLSDHQNSLLSFSDTGCKQKLYIIYFMFFIWNVFYVFFEMCIIFYFLILTLKYSLKLLGSVMILLCKKWLSKFWFKDLYFLTVDKWMSLVWDWNSGSKITHKNCKCFWH